MFLKPSSQKHHFELDLEISELTNIPQLTGTSFLVLTISNHRSVKNHQSRLHSKSTFKDISKKIPIKNHKCNFNYELKNVPIKLYEESKTKILSDKWLHITFYTEIKNNNSSNRSKLGLVEINLTEYVNDREKINNRYLLQESKVNSICKLSLFIKHIDEASYETMNPSSSFQDKKYTFNIPNRTTTQIFQGLTKSLDQTKKNSMDSDISGYQRQSVARSSGSDMHHHDTSNSTQVSVLALPQHQHRQDRSVSPVSQGFASSQQLHRSASNSTSSPFFGTPEPALDSGPSSPVIPPPLSVDGRTANDFTHNKIDTTAETPASARGNHFSTLTATVSNSSIPRSRHLSPLKYSSNSNLNSHDLTSTKSSVSSNYDSDNKIDGNLSSNASSTMPLSHTTNASIANNNAINFTALQNVSKSSKALGSIFNNPLLSSLINKTYQFSWMKSDDINDNEFTPLECVQDICEHNGTGWRRNEEGNAYIDLIRHSRSRNNRSYNKNGRRGDAGHRNGNYNYYRDPYFDDDYSDGDFDDGNSDSDAESRYSNGPHFYVHGRRSTEGRRGTSKVLGSIRRRSYYSSDNNNDEDDGDSSIYDYGRYGSGVNDSNDDDDDGDDDDEENEFDHFHDEGEDDISGDDYEDNDYKYAKNKGKLSQTQEEPVESRIEQKTEDDLENAANTAALGGTGQDEIINSNTVGIQHNSEDMWGSNDVSSGPNKSPRRNTDQLNHMQAEDSKKIWIDPVNEFQVRDDLKSWHISNSVMN
ncbi:hypothetical protein B5S33_g98 [[Candida] boidinii]|nr:hypothetical protein B5S33_g98 [[Candida] boidinii]